MKLWLNVAEGAEYAGVCRGLIRLLDNRPIRRAIGDNLETPEGRNS